MSDEDIELERLKAKRLAEMQKNIHTRKEVESKPKEPEQKQDPRQIVVSRLGYRGLEVLQNAEAQYPKETRMIISQLAELLSSGEIDEQLDGGKLLLLFRAVGLNIRMETKINVEQDGKFVSLSDKLRTKSEGED